MPEEGNDLPNAKHFGTKSALQNNVLLKTCTAQLKCFWVVDKLVVVMIGSGGQTSS